MSFWTDEKVETIKTLWKQGLTASQIGERVGHTRNAVISKLHRIGMMGDQAPRKRPRKPSTKRAPHFNGRKPAPAAKPRVTPSVEFEPEPFVSTFEELVIPVCERKSLLDLTEASCRWPIGDPQSAEFHFCNGTKVLGLPYCETHARRAFQPVQPKSRPKPVREPAPAEVHHEREKVDA